LRDLYRGSERLSPDEVGEVRALLSQLEVRGTAEAMTREHYAAALTALARTGAVGGARSHIESLCASLLNREF
ncbi:MAG TPA: hypothetical protein VHX16_06250, partial [Chloroflexota bacterium]|nr:hypothetical protein [Chloroflexota bacterium]